MSTDTKTTEVVMNKIEQMEKMIDKRGLFYRTLPLVEKEQIYENKKTELIRVINELELKTIYDLPSEVLDSSYGRTIEDRIQMSSVPVTADIAAETARTTTDNPRLPWIIEDLEDIRKYALSYLTESYDVMVYLILGDPPTYDPEERETTFLFQYGMMRHRAIEEACSVAKGFYDDEIDYLPRKSKNFMKTEGEEETYSNFRQRTLAEAFDVIRRTQAILTDSSWDFLNMWPTYFRVSPVYSVVRCDTLKIKHEPEPNHSVYNIVYDVSYAADWLIKRGHEPLSPFENVLQTTFCGDSNSVAIFIADEIVMIQSSPIWTKKRVKILLEKIRTSRLNHWRETGIGPSWAHQ